MKKSISVFILVSALSLVASFGFAEKAEKGGKSGEELYKANCASCHPKGGNIVNPQFTLDKKAREAHGVKTAGDIVNKMRNPGPGMTKFDKGTISDKDAKKIADYVIKTFK